MSPEKVPDCDHCPEHGEHRAELQFLKTDISEIKQSQAATLDFLRQDLRQMQQEIIQNRDSLHRRISERIPIRHAITGITIMVGIVTSIITFFALSTGRIDEKLDKLQRDVAVMAAVSEERKYQLDFQKQLLGVLIESLEEKQGEGHMHNRSTDPATYGIRPGNRE